MNELPEHIKGEIAELPRLDAEIEGLEDRLRELRLERQELIDRQAQSVAAFSVGHTYENRNGVRFRITKVKGDYYVTEYVSQPITWVRYRGVRMYKNGNEGREETLYPLEAKKSA